MTMTHIETVEVGAGGAASIEFTSIPQDGVDLVILLSLRDTTSDSDRSVKLTLNSDTTSSYPRLWLTGDGSIAQSGGNTQTYLYAGQTNAATSTSNTFGNIQVYLSNYTSSSNKSASVDAVYENNATEAKQYLIADTYENSTGITSVLIDSDGNFVQYSTASLYKVS